MQSTLKSNLMNLIKLNETTQPSIIIRLLTRNYVLFSFLSCIFRLLFLSSPGSSDLSPPYRSQTSTCNLVCSHLRQKTPRKKKAFFVHASFFYSVHSSMLPSSPASPPLLPLAPVLSSTPDFYISLQLPT